MPSNFCRFLTASSESTLTCIAFVLRAVNFGGDADTVGAVAGQMAGSRFGFEAIRHSGLFDGLAMANELFASPPLKQTPLHLPSNLENKYRDW